MPIFHLDNNSILLNKIVSKEVDIKSNEWVMNEVVIFEEKMELLNLET